MPDASSRADMQRSMLAPRVAARHQDVEVCCNADAKDIEVLAGQGSGMKCAMHTRLGAGGGAGLANQQTCRATKSERSLTRSVEAKPLRISHVACPGLQFARGGDSGCARAAGRSGWGAGAPAELRHALRCPPLKSLTAEFRRKRLKSRLSGSARQEYQAAIKLRRHIRS